ncbi:MULTISPECIES: hypothetical protein [Legionella]|uniref:Uncharacterized protein n=1 Tax=Legionella septentrionalis TaxID=2498109 RepID=A0A433JH88_9GAMM|nr:MULTISPECIES: hypothetical protein [Legionella]MCP0913025.1 hypothetical protein [Legionella sp. 27cVA30]RUQ81685.1 hypothetical protein EKM59_09880 [Legionella septentrionalis]RUQ98510.1 hypothetical protein ELY11_05690 [Legionella septentrionalis]RUR10897.1 hypothetical protein ELY14_03590 [Legionella septentrionalis]RUR15337.1 hypothetical protein ELY10_05920 [Legionella septentrionalis]
MKYIALTLMAFLAACSGDNKPAAPPKPQASVQKSQAVAGKKEVKKSAVKQAQNKAEITIVAPPAKPEVTLERTDGVNLMPGNIHEHARHSVHKHHHRAHNHHGHGEQGEITVAARNKSVHKHEHQSRQNVHGHADNLHQHANIADSNVHGHD